MGMLHFTAACFLQSSKISWYVMILGSPNLYSIFDEIILHPLAKYPWSIPTICVCIEGCLRPSARFPINQLPILHSGHLPWSSHCTRINLCSTSFPSSFHQSTLPQWLPSSFSLHLNFILTFYANRFSKIFVSSTSLVCPQFGTLPCIKGRPNWLQIYTFKDGFCCKMRMAIDVKMQH